MPRRTTRSRPARGLTRVVRTRAARAGGDEVGACCEGEAWGDFEKDKNKGEVTDEGEKEEGKETITDEGFGEDDGEDERKNESDEGCGDPSGRTRACRGEEGEAISGGGGEKKKSETNSAIGLEAIFGGASTREGLGGAHKVRLVCRAPRWSL